MELKEVLLLVDKDELVQIIDAEGNDLFKGLLSDMSKLIYTCKCKVSKLTTDANGYLVLNIAKDTAEEENGK